MNIAPINPRSHYVFPNMELGDNIICNGMARKLACLYPHVSWVAKHAYASEIARMLSDVPNLTVVDGYDYPEAKEHLRGRATSQLTLAYFGPLEYEWKSIRFDVDFYKEAGIYFRERWDSFNLPPGLLPAATGIRPTKVLLHEVAERGFTIDRHRCPAGELTVMHRRASFWDWLPEIYGAEEIHVVDSSYLNLIESLYAIGLLRNTKLVFHFYSKCRIHGAGAPVLLAPWTFLG